MLPRDQVDSLTVGILGVIFVSSSLIFFLPPLLVGAAGRDAWLAALVAAPLIAVVVAAWLRFYFLPGLTPLDRTGGRPLLRGVVAWLLAAYALYQGGSVLGETVGVLVIIYPETPAAVFHGSLVLAAWVLAVYGREVIARTAVVLAPVMLLTVLGNLALVVPSNVDAGQLLPILETGWGRLLAGLPFMAATTAEAFLLSFFADGIRDRPRIGRALALAAAVSILLLAGVTTLDLTILGPQETARNVVPTLVVMRLVRLAPVLARVESLIFSAWLLGIFVKLALCIYVAGLAMREGLGLTERWRTVIKTTAAALTLASAAYFFPDMGRVQDQLASVWPAVGTGMLLLSLALGFVRVAGPAGAGHDPGRK
ncbi:MAG TPA: GerAB/ArcD/ProY family transporter [Thermaerobacter sp.]